MRTEKPRHSRNIRMGNLEARVSPVCRGTERKLSCLKTWVLEGMLQVRLKPDGEWSIHEAKAVQALFYR